MRCKLNNNTSISEAKSWLFEKTRLTNRDTNLLSEREDKRVRDEKWDIITDNDEIWRNFKGYYKNF